MNLYDYINSYDSKSIFLYLIIFVLLLSYFKSSSVGTNILIALIIGTFIVVYINAGKESSESNDQIQMKTKYDNIRPQSKAKKIKNYPDLTNFVFSIQDFYVENPQAFEDMLDNLDAFLALYENAVTEPKLANKTFKFAEIKKHNALNSLQSIIYNMPTDKISTNKLSVAVRTLEQLLNNYLEKMYHMSQESVYKNGYDTSYVPIDFGPKPHNFYLKTKYTFDLF
jgi:hypothetical protein